MFTVVVAVAFSMVSSCHTSICYEEDRKKENTHRVLVVTT
jgi:hypothetical protein